MQTILNQIWPEAAYKDASAIYDEFFKEDDGRGCEFIRNQWTPEGLKLIREILSEGLS